MIRSLAKRFVHSFSTNQIAIAPGSAGAIISMGRFRDQWNKIKKTFEFRVYTVSDSVS